MKIIIVGGGKLGKDIADNMMERKYDVRFSCRHYLRRGYRIGSSGGSRNKKCRLLYLCYR